MIKNKLILCDIFLQKRIEEEELIKFTPDDDGKFSVYVHKGDLGVGFVANQNANLWRLEMFDEITPVIRQYVRSRQTIENTIRYQATMTVSNFRTLDLTNFLIISLFLISVQKLQSRLRRQFFTGSCNLFRQNREERKCD